MTTSQFFTPAFDGSELTTLDLFQESLVEAGAPVRNKTDHESETYSEAGGQEALAELSPGMVGRLGASGHPYAQVIELPQFKPLINRPTEFFAAVQEWEGTITQVGAEGFTANLYDMNGERDEVSELAEISFDDIDPADRPRVREGAIFRWLIGHSRTRAGQFSRKWVIYFRRAPRSKERASPFLTVNIPDALR